MSEPQSNNPTDHVAAALAMATEDELIAELARRSSAIIFARVKPARESDTEESLAVYRGSFLAAVGLSVRMQTRLAEIDHASRSHRR